MRLKDIVQRLPEAFIRNSTRQIFRLIDIYVFERLKIHVDFLYFQFHKKWSGRVNKLLVNGKIRELKKAQGEIIQLSKRNSYHHQLKDFISDPKQIDMVEKAAQEAEEVVIADIDKDGFWMSHFDKISGVPTISQEKFLKRKRHAIQVIYKNDNIYVKKIYNNKISFANELMTLHRLRKVGCRVPAIVEINFGKLILTCSLIKGAVLREELANQGAVLRDVDVLDRPEFMSLSKIALRLKRIEEGKRVLYGVIDQTFVDELYAELLKVHAAGVFWNDFKYGNIIIEEKTGKPYLIDFERSSCCGNSDRSLFVHMQDQDIEDMNLHFNTEKMTYAKLKREINGWRVYAPVYFGAGLKAGGIWSVDSGYGRWHYILKKHYPDIFGKRILDLGANNGQNAMQLLRHGAQEVIGVELEDEFINQGKIVKSGYEWADKKVYDFKHIQADMREVPKLDLGRFDIVQALCCIYYLPDKDIEELAKYIATISDCFILQCNIKENIGRNFHQTYEKASVESALAILEKSGYSNTEVFAPFKYSRPLVIGTK
jgi:tRNA A-37 threonylcarbamoyl transferase component Bud32/2-polyprenyl-3-methyl-5-hydroxy-6-metoxy-1,4-benzoquinol methylase